LGASLVKTGDWKFKEKSVVLWQQGPLPVEFIHHYDSLGKYLVHHLEKGLAVHDLVNDRKFVCWKGKRSRMFGMFSLFSAAGNIFLSAL